MYFRFCVASAISAYNMSFFLPISSGVFRRSLARRSNASNSALTDLKYAGSLMDDPSFHIKNGGYRARRHAT